MGKPPKAAVRQPRIMIASNAGGSGKTTLAAHLAYGVGCRGYKVTLMELDHNGSMSLFGGLQPPTPEDSVASLLKQGFKPPYPAAPIWSDSLKTVNCIQGGEPLKDAIVEVYNNPRRYYALADCLEDSPLDSDLIIFDTPASLEPMGSIALAASTHLLVPIKPEFKDSNALAGLVNWYYEQINLLRLRPAPSFLGFVPSRVDLDIAIHRNILGVDKKGQKNPAISPEETLPYQIGQYGVPCFPLIRESPYYLWASGAGLPLHLYRPGSKFTLDFDPVIEDVVRLMTEE